MKFENIRVFNFEGALRGMRNPKNSWNRSDSVFGIDCDTESIAMRTNPIPYTILNADNGCFEFAAIGPNDMDLAKRLIMAGSEHRKFLRQIFVSVDITAPLYW